MSHPDFPGSHHLTDAIDQAVVLGCQKRITDTLRRSLCRLMHERLVTLPDCCYQPLADHYARRLLYRSDAYGYSVVCMTWGPGQGTPIHDHAGMWCVEGVWHGELEITQYELSEQHDDRVHLQPVGTMQAGPGSAGSLIPPHEFHAIRNPSPDAIAVSLHIYRGSMDHCAIYQPTDDGSYTRTLRRLSLDGTH